jgi:hypothetical protein
MDINSKGELDSRQPVDIQMMFTLAASAIVGLKKYAELREDDEALYQWALKTHTKNRGSEPEEEALLFVQVVKSLAHRGPLYEPFKAWISTQN